MHEVWLYDRPTLPLGPKGLWVQRVSHWGPCWVDMTSGSRTPFGFQKSCGSPKIPDKCHLPYRARRLADPACPSCMVSDCRIDFV
jgi:hypothetical protein